MDRRGFLNAGGSALAGLALPGILKAETCPDATSADRYGYGPYYLEGAPERTHLAVGAPGQQLRISGTVSDCRGPVPGATLEVWHATAEGCYIHPSLPACVDHGDPENSRHWGLLVTDAEGAYSFDTVKPGVYLNGSSYRPSHIHFRIRSPKGRVPETDLVTQLYFAGDPYIAGDLGAADPAAKSRIITLSFPVPVRQGELNEPGSAALEGAMVGEFNVTVPEGTMGLRGNGDPFSDPALRGFDAFVQRSGDVFRIFLPPVPAGTQVEARLYGASGRLFRRSLHSWHPIELDASLWPRGAYQALLLWHTAGGERSEWVSLRR
jgi:protocatechuate 3,4-dioxygenase beta subunit